MAEPKKISIDKQVRSVSFIGGDEPAIRISGAGGLKTIKAGPDYALEVASRMGAPLPRELPHLMINMAGLSSRPSRLSLDVSEGATVKLESQKYGLAEVAVSGKGKVQTMAGPEFIADVRLVEGKEKGSIVMEGKMKDGMYKAVLSVSKDAKIDIIDQRGKIIYPLDGRKTLKENQSALERAQSGRVGFLSPADVQKFTDSGIMLTAATPAGVALTSVTEGRQENPAATALPPGSSVLKI